MMKVYVVIPTHNSEQTIEQTLSSFYKVKKEITIELEAIIVDDHSTDRTVNVIQNMFRDSLIIANKGKGVSEARNTALKYLFEREEDGWVTFLDADDYLVTPFFENLSKLDLIGFDYVLFRYEVCHLVNLDSIKENEDSNDVKLNIMNPDSAIQRAIEGFNNSHYNCNSPWGRIISLKFLKKNNILFNPSLVYKEDYLFNLELFNSSPMIGLCNQTGYIHIINEKSVVNSFIENALSNDKLINLELKKMNLTQQQQNRALFNAWRGLVFVYIFPKRHLLDTLGERKKRFNEVFDFTKKVPFYGHFWSKEYVIYILYKIKAFYLLDLIFLKRRL